MNKLYFVVRHAESYRDWDFLTEKWKDQARETWEVIKEICQQIKNQTVKIITSSANRAKQTWEQILTWIKVDCCWIHIIEVLRDDEHADCDTKKALEEINKFVDFSIVIIVAHMGNIWETAKWLWYKWELIENPGNCAWYWFDENWDEIWRNAVSDDDFLDDETDYCFWYWEEATWTQWAQNLALLATEEEWPGLQDWEIAEFHWK